MMKKIFVLLTCVLLVGFVGCSKSVKGSADANGGWGEEGIYDQGVGGSGSLPGRDSSVNPDNADFSVLAAYTVYFDFDSFGIKSGERSKLESVARWMNDNPGSKIIVAGNTDDRGTTEYNMGLGERRSLSTRDYLVGLGVDASRVSTISYGEEKPAEDGQNESAWAKNRRAQIGVVR
jgi:peptidoglycan-associated lipoprotein